MNQIDVNVYDLHEVDEQCCLISCIDYLSKWSKGKSLTDEKAVTVL